MPDENEQIQSRAGGNGAETGRGRNSGRRDLPEDGDHRDDILSVEEEVWREGTPEIRELRQLREENRKLKQLVADLSLDKTILQESLRKKW